MARTLLTDFELMILLAILRAGEDAYGVPIGREIEQTSGRSVVLGAVHTVLDRLERNGLVRSRAIKGTLHAFVAPWTDVAELKGGHA